MSYTLVKTTSPNLVDKSIIDKIFRLNNSEISDTFSKKKDNIINQTKMLCYDFYENTLNFIRQNYIYIIVFAILVYIMYYRYQFVKNEKKNIVIHEKDTILEQQQQYIQKLQDQLQEQQMLQEQQIQEDRQKHQQSQQQELNDNQLDGYFKW